MKLLLGLTAILNVVQAALDEACIKIAARQVNAAVVEIHREVRWEAQDLGRMVGIQAWLVAELTRSESPSPLLRQER